LFGILWIVLGLSGGFNQMSWVLKWVRKRVFRSRNQKQYKLPFHLEKYFIPEI